MDLSTMLPNWMIAFVLCFVMVSGAEAQSCGIAPVVAANSKPNMFSPEQEMWLGEAWGDMIVDENVPIKDASLNQHLQAIVDKLAEHLPEPHVKFHVVLVESPEVNGWSIAGGSIFITRKLAATAESDDELASVLGHEMGHIASHQFAFEMTEEFRRLLGVTSLGDKKDVYAKYHALIDASMKDKHPPKVKEDDAQDEADRIGIYLTAAAGYDVASFPTFFDRSFFVGGKTGGTLTDLFGLTKPNEKRLRGMKAMVAALPAGCGKTPRSAEEQVAFGQWRKRVRENQKSATAEVVVAEGEKLVKLEQPLQMEVNRVRFSPDGKLLLAQDESSVYVLSHQPWEVKFRLDADDAQWAWFSPDSTKVTFATPGLHTEEWSVADGKLVMAHEPVARHECVQTRLSPDGRTIVCVSFKPDAWMLALSLLDSTSGQVLWETNHFFQPSFAFGYELLVGHELGLASELLYSSFSSDGNTLLIGPGDDKLAFDLRTRQPIALNGEIKSTITGPYAFIGNDRLAGVQVGPGGVSGVFSFPQGKRLSRVPFGLGEMESISNTGGKDLALSRSVYGMLQNKDEKADKKDGYKNAARVESRIGVNDLDNGKWIIGSHSTALDMWENDAVTEAADGELALAKMVDWKETNRQLIRLPISPLGRLRAVAMSPDGKYLAYSTRDRSGVWDLATGKRLAILNAFQDVTWPDSMTMVGDFEKSSKGDRLITVFDLTTHSSHPAVEKLADDPKDREAMSGGYFTEWKTEKGSAKTLILHSFKDHSVLWSKIFKEGYPRWVAPDGGHELFFTYPMEESTAKSMIKADSALQEQAAEVKKKESGRVIEIVDAATGVTKAKMALELPGDYAGTGGLNHVGDDLLVTGDDNRTLVYSVKTGKRLWQTFGWVLTVDPVKERVALWNRANEVIVFDAAGNELLHTQVGAKVRFAAFDAKGASLSVLTSDQAVHRFSMEQREILAGAH